MSGGGDDRRDYPRWPVGEPATLLVNGEALDCTVEDVSASGARVVVAKRLEPGTEIVLRLAEMPAIDATVARLTVDGAAVRFKRGPQYVFR